MTSRAWKGLYLKGQVGHPGMSINYDVNNSLTAAPPVDAKAELVRLRVLNRCRFLTYPAMEKYDNRMDRPDMRGGYAYVGFGACMQGPVLAHGNREGKSDCLDRQEADNWRVLTGPENRPNPKVEFKHEPACLLTGNGWIPHYSMLRPANFEAIGRYVNGQALRGVDIETWKGFRSASAKAMEMLGQGNSPKVPELVPAGPEGEATPANGGDTTATTPIMEQRSYSALILKRGLEKISGFILKVAYVDALEFPPELIKILKDFAAKHQLDYLPLRQLLTACILWSDIIRTPKLQMEAYMRVPGKTQVPVPKIPLAVALVYFGHMLRWVERMGLAEYPHFFRFCAKAMESDFQNLLISVDPLSIDEDEVFALLQKVESRVPGVKVSDRLEIWPWMIPGSVIPKVHGPDAPEQPSAIPMALTGITHIRYYGLSEYYPPPLKELPEGTPRHRWKVRDWMEVAPKCSFIYLPSWVMDDTPLRHCNSPGGMLKPPKIKLKSTLPFWVRSTFLTSSKKKRVIEYPSPSSFGYDKIQAMVWHWDALVYSLQRPEIHLAWHENRDEAAAMVGTPPPVKDVRAVVRKTLEEVEADSTLMRMKIQTASHHFPILEEDVAYTLPRVMGRMVGIPPHPSDELGGTLPELLWEQYYVPEILRRHPESKAPTLGSHLLNTLRGTNIRDPDAVTTMKVRALSWLNKFKDYLQPDLVYKWMQQWHRDFPKLAAPLSAADLGIEEDTQDQDGEDPQHHLVMAPVPTVNLNRCLQMVGVDGGVGQTIVPSDTDSSSDSSSDSSPDVDVLTRYGLESGLAGGPAGGPSL